MTKVKIYMIGHKNVTLIRWLTLELDPKEKDLHLENDFEEGMTITIKNSKKYNAKNITKVLANTLKKIMSKCTNNFSKDNFNIVPYFNISPFYYTVSYCYCVYKALLDGYKSSDSAWVCDFYYEETKFEKWYVAFCKEFISFFKERASFIIEENEFRISLPYNLHKVLRNTKKLTDRTAKLPMVLKVNNIKNNSININSFGRISFKNDTFESMFERFHFADYMFELYSVLNECVKLDKKGK